MRRFVLAAAALTLAAAFFLVGRDASAAAAPSVSSIVEGREGDTNAEVVIVVGNNLTGVSQFNLADSQNILTGLMTLKLKTKNLLVFGLPPGLQAGTYKLRLFYGKGASGEIAFDIVLTNLAVAPSSVTSISLDPALRVDLEDATTVGGRSASYLTDAGNLTGTLDPARFSAYGDLVAEVKLGTKAGQVAPGDHLHDARYVLRTTDTVSAANLTFSSATGTPVTATSSAAAGIALAASASGAGGVGLAGTATSTTGASTGVHGSTGAAAGYGVLGDTSAASGSGVYGSATNSAGNATAVGVTGVSASAQGFGMRGTATGTSGVGIRGEATSGSGSTVGIHAFAQSPSGLGMLVQSQGAGLSVGAQTTGMTVDTAAAASASGAIAVFQQGGTNKARIDTNGKGYFNGGTATTGADFAESVETALPVARYEPGDVMVIDVKGTRRFDLSSSPNSKLVAGVYATKPGVLARPGDVAGDSKWTDTEVPMAIVGIVPCKVVDENGAIEAGDLLVTSSTPGHAMKAPENPVAGTVVGKALGNLAGKKGKVEVLLIGR